MFKAHIIESEAGWGSRIDETLEFETKEERDRYVKEYNDKYNPPLPGGRVPTWYMVAQAAD